jgi:hypothetical protein
MAEITLMAARFVGLSGVDIEGMEQSRDCIGKNGIEMSIFNFNLYALRSTLENQYGARLTKAAIWRLRVGAWA